MDKDYFKRNKSMLGGAISVKIIVLYDSKALQFSKWTEQLLVVDMDCLRRSVGKSKTENKEIHILVWCEEKKLQIYLI